MRVPTKLSDWVGRSKFIRSHWVRLTPTGSLVGRISLLDVNGGARGAQSLNVRLYRNGVLVAQALTDVQGGFRLKNLRPGVYSLIAEGQNGLAAYGLHALQHQQKNSMHLPGEDPIRFVQAIEVGETLEISTAAVPPTFEQVRGILSEKLNRIQTRYVPKQEYTELLRRIETLKAPGWDDPNGPEEFRGLRELQRGGTTKNRTRPATAIRTHDVVLEKARRGWVIRGRLYGIDPVSGRSVQIQAGSTEVTLIQNDQRVAVDKVRAEGEFDFYGIDEGVYSLVAIGNDGFGAIAFRAVRPQDDDVGQRRDASPIRMVQLDVDGRPAEGAPFAGAIGGVGGSSDGLTVAMVNDKVALQDAFRNLGVFAAGAPGPAGLIVPLVDAPRNAPYDVIGDTILPDGPPIEFSHVPPPAGLLAPTGGTSLTGRGGRSILGSGGLFGVVGGAAAIIALSDDGNDPVPVTPFMP